MFWHGVANDGLQVVTGALEESYLQAAHKPNFIGNCAVNSDDWPFNDSLSAAPVFGCMHVSAGCFLKTAAKSNILLFLQSFEGNPSGRVP